jgi:methylenetetrahydrofolate reductase (NADPH)
LLFHHGDDQELTVGWAVASQRTLVGALDVAARGQGPDFDVDAFARWMSQVRDLGLHERCHILAGAGPITSVRALSHLQRDVPGVHIPADVARRLLAVPASHTADEGVSLCAETIEALRQIPGVAGVHIMAPGGEERIPLILQRAGRSPAPEPGPPAASPATSASVRITTGGADHAC